ncbi:MAG TPA: cytochrome c3 family protein, partial [Thermodesulfobacteriota bacterium]|nr:cytochrome c3 family protein [Thermodesulfobacteriota bacterium]
MGKTTLQISILLLLFLSFPIDGKTQEQLSPNSAKECAICHFNWIDEFYREGRHTFLADLPKDKMAANEMMCYSCHDGSVVDSRFRVWETNRHKPGLMPSAKVRIPSFFPLAKDGSVQCYTCHSAHGVDTRPGIEATIFLRTSNKDSAMCRECHVGKDRGPKKGSHPVDVTSLEIPKEIFEAGGKTGTKKNQIICQTCHTPHGSSSDKFLVIPNSGKGITHSELCETCHTVKPNIKEKSKMRAYSHPVDVLLVAGAKLPEKWDNGEAPYLSEYGEINCRTCHSPHNGISKSHLLVAKNEKGSLCITCHQFKKAVAYSKHNMEIVAPDEKNLDGKKVSETGVCSACHFMHKGKGAKMWARDVPDREGEDVISKLCKSCHSEDRVGGKKLTGEFSHPVAVNPPEGADITDLPLFDRDGKKVREGKVTCATCHDVHQWDPLNPDLPVSKETEGDALNSFLRKRAAPSSGFCERCHPDKSYIEKTSHDLSITAPNALNIRREPIAKSGVCGACHLIHNARAAKLWARTPGAGKDVIERLCKGCHAEGGMAEKKLTGAISHPLGKTPDYPETSPKILPLYNEKGWKDQNGNVSCATCHNVHQWDPGLKGKGTGKKIEGDRFNSFLRIPYDEDASLCSNCHNKAMVKGTKHDL